MSPAFLKLFLAALAISAPALPRSQEAVAEATSVKASAFSEEGPFEVAQVVDADTIHVHRDDKVEKLRLLSVDTEERQWGRQGYSSSKPETASECSPARIA